MSGCLRNCCPDNPVYAWKAFHKGKSHLSIALGLRACQNGFRVKFTSAATLATMLVEAKDSKELLKLERKLQKAELLIIDELSYLSFNRHQSELLFKVISDRGRRGLVKKCVNVRQE